ncbi:PBP1A family penicillin-binding protein [Fulvimarina pelagi]|nr:PBP1A family penicillin-binding protein [Fulvimarina pelagi]
MPRSRARDESRAAPSTREAFGTLYRALAADAARGGRAFAGWARRTTVILGKKSATWAKLFAQKLRSSSARIPRGRPGTGSAFRWPALRMPKLSRSSWTKARAFKYAAIGLVSAVIIVAAFAAYVLRGVPYTEILAGSSQPIITLTTADGEPLIQRGAYQGAYTPLEAFPEHLTDAVVSIEDRRFFSHGGLDYRGIGRALVANVSEGEVVEGGSTITQQLLKILYLERERTFMRKAQEFFLAYWLESNLSKEEILTRYLNNIYLGAGATGVPAAARIYFNKEVGELDVAESALLAGLIHSPSQLNPFVNLDGAKARAKLVLAAMRDTGRLDDTQAGVAMLDATRLDPQRPEADGGSWFADWVMEDAREVAGPFRGGVSFRTTLDPRLQEIAQTIVARELDENGEESGVSQASMVALRPDGAVVAMIGGRDYEASQFNRAFQAKRQPGSTFKLFVYFAALKAGMSPRDRIEDAPIEVSGWSPENYSGGYSGRVRMADAFARSLNAATARLAMEVGIENVVGAARELGIDAPLEAVPSLALGTSEVSLVDLTGAYASVRAGVAPVEPWGIASFGIEDSDRTFRIGPGKQPTSDLSPYQEPLVGMLRRVVERGTGEAAQLDGFAAGKTGTSQESRDAWFVGFNEELTVGVWVGNDDGTPMNEVTGGGLPARIWRAFMEEASGESAAAQTQEDDGEKEPRSGRSAPESITELVRGSAEPEPQQCNVRACSRAYRSFRVSDCTFQPYRGPRKLCDR